MINLLNDPEVVQMCETASQHEMVEHLTGGKLRGLEKLALVTLANRKQLPPNVVNVLIVYFFSTFVNKVYDRNDLARLYDYWASNHVYSFAKAKEMTEEKIENVLAGLK
jgi:replication initiation and membrane attachment protein DnaB